MLNYETEEATTRELCYCYVQLWIDAREKYKNLYYAYYYLLKFN